MSQIAKRRKQIIDFGNSVEYRELSAYYSQPNTFRIAGWSRHEETHNNIIAWLLNPSSNHGLGDLGLRKLFETLALICDSLPHAIGKLPTSLSGALTVGNYALSNVTVTREKHVGVGRLDIYIEGVIENHSFCLAIENKVKSTESDAQTERYHAAITNSTSCPEFFLGIYLTPLNNREYEALVTPECVSKDFIQLNYQYLANYVITPCLNAAPVNLKSYFSEYLLALGLPELKQKKGDIIMAINHEERELLSRFWGAHKNLLLAALSTLVVSDILEEEELDSVEEALAPLSSSRRDSTRYSWKFLDGAGGVNLAKNRLVLEVVAHHAQTKAPLALSQLKAAFPDELGPSGFGIVETLSQATPDNFKGHKRYMTNDDQIVHLADGPAAVCNQWRADNLPRFIANAAKLGYEISSTG